MIRGFFLFSLISSSLIYSYVEKTIDEKSLIEVPFSRNSHNRISIKEGHVAKVHGDGSVFSVSIDEVTGNAFILLKKDIDKGAVLTLVTDSGVIQDLLITSIEGSSEHLVLKELEYEKEEYVQTNPEFFHKKTVELLNSILNDQIPFGYGLRELSDKESIKLPNPLSARMIKSYEGPFEIIVVYKIKNSGKKIVSINPDSLKSGENSWVFLTSPQIEHNQQTICLISYPKMGGNL